jgi:hypothetical protein
MSDYFINHRNINAYTINAFAEAIVEATQQGLALNYDSARRIGTSFSISIASEEETVVETQETPADQTESVEAQPADADGEESEEGPCYSDGEDFEGYSERVGNTEGVIEDARTENIANKPQPFTLEDIEQAKGSMNDLNKLGEPVGISARSKREMVKLLKEYIGA